MIQAHPFTRTGFITIVDAAGKQVFDPAQTDSPTAPSWPRRSAC